MLKEFSIFSLCYKGKFIVEKRGNMNFDDYVDKFYKTIYNNITNTCKTTTQI